MLTQLENTRTGLDFRYSETVLFDLLPLLYIFSIGEAAEGKKCCPKPQFPWFACLCHSWKRGTFLACEERDGHFHKAVLIIPQNSCLSFVTYYGQKLLLHCSHVRQGIAGSSASFTGKTGDDDFLHSLPSSQAVHNTPLTASLGRLWGL